MPAALPLQTNISQASSANRQYRIIKVRYGNGYEQRARDGINNVEDSWNVQWTKLSSTDFNTLVSALDAAYGVDYFTWTAPGDSAEKKWVVEQVTKTVSSGLIYSVTATLKQVFDL